MPEALEHQMLRAKARLKKTGITIDWGRLPPHVTVMPPFSMENERALRALMQNFPRIIEATSATTTLEWLSQHPTLALMLVNGSCSGLMQNTRKALEGIGVPKWGSNETFPHITLARSVEEGDKVAVFECLNAIGWPSSLALRRITLFEEDEHGTYRESAGCLLR